MIEINTKERHPIYRVRFYQINQTMYEVEASSQSKAEAAARKEWAKESAPTMIHAPELLVNPDCDKCGLNKAIGILDGKPLCDIHLKEKLTELVLLG